MNYNQNPPPSIKEAMLLSFAGLFPFATNPLRHASNARFWLCDADGRATQVPGQVWLERFPYLNRRKRGCPTTIENQGGRIVFGLGEAEDERRLDDVESRLPGLLPGALGQELVGSGWALGRFAFGLHRAEEGTTFDRRSVVLQIAGIGSAKLGDVTLCLAEDLDQACVFTFDDCSGEMSLVGPDR